MKSITSILCLIFLLTGISNGQEELVIDRVIGQVGSEFVLLSELEEQLAYARERQALPDEAARCQIMEALIGNKLLVHQAKLDSVEVTDEEVNTQLDARIDRILSLMNNDQEYFREYYGKSVVEMKADMRDDLERQLLANKMRQQILSKTRVTPSEVVAFYNSVPFDSLPYFNSEVELREISIKPRVNDEERAKAIEKLEGIRQRILKGENFDQLASTYSDDPGSARNGGDLGWMKRGTLVPEYEATAYNLEKDEISEVIESEFGFHIIQLLGRRGNSIHTRHILVKPAITEPDLEKIRLEMLEIKELIETDSFEFSEAVKEFGDDDNQSFHNGGRLVNPATGNTFFEIGELDPDIYFTIDTMEVGDISQPILYYLPTGEQAYRIIQLTSRSEPHRANLQQDYNKILTATREQKKAEAFKVWMETRLKSTFISVEPEFLDCINIRALVESRS